MRIKKMKIGRRILLFVILFWLYSIYQKPIILYKNIDVKKGCTLNSILNNLDFMDVFRIKIYSKLNNIDFSKLKQGNYIFSGSYEKYEFVDKILNGPQKKFLKITLLEGWSVYDIDYFLFEKGYIEKGQYLKFVSDHDFILSMQNHYDFLKNISLVKLKSLEGFLYPDTYNIDISQDFLSQLVKLQLKTFDKKVWEKYKDRIVKFKKNIKSDYNLNFDRYDIVSLVSVIEKEEKNNKNKSTIAGIFFNRLSMNMRLDADITLCYGLKKPYNLCTPEVIVNGIYDEKNIYNTRKNNGLVPSPIANFSVDTFFAVLNYNKTNNFYYLHDSMGGIHYAKTIKEHLINKNKYL